ncbi:MAG: ABC transporter substrate-binding protein [Thermomicrobiales bacterium]
MTRKIEIEEMLRKASPATRREFLRRAAVTGISGPALAAMLTGINPASVLAEGDDCPGKGASADQFASMPVRLQGEPVQGGTFVVTGHQEVDSLSPDNAGASVPWTAITQIHNALLERDENLEWQPVLAEAMPEMSADGLQYTFTLRQGVLFHNGEEFTSADVKYYYDFHLNPDNATILGSEFSSVESVETPDEYTVVVNMKSTDAAFFDRVASMFIPSSTHHQAVGEDAYKGDPIGTGPFRLVEWNAAASTLMEAFPEHFRGAPNLAEFRLDVVPEPSQRAIGLETGDADSSAWPLVTEDNIRLAEDTENFTTIITSTLGLNHIPLNNTNPKLSDKRVRQAMMYAIDRQALIDDIFQGTATIAVSNLSPASPWHNPDVTTYEYDPERAAALLDEAGWVLDGDMRAKDGETLSFVCTTITGDQVRRPEAEVVQQYLREVGIDMQLEEAPVATILEQLPQGEMDASLFNWTYGDVEPDASFTLGTGAETNFSQYSNPLVDDLLAAGLVELDEAARREIYNEIQAIVADDVPFLMLMYWDWYNIFAKRVKGLPETAEGGFEIYTKAYQFWIEE